MKNAVVQQRNATANHVLAKAAQGTIVPAVATSKTKKGA
jgi:hypothetical protein